MPSSSRSNKNQTFGTPDSVAQDTPDLDKAIGQTRTIINAVQGDIRDIRENISGIRASQHSDFRIVVSMFAAGFVVIGSMLVLGYFRLEDQLSKTEDKITKVDDRVISQITSNTRVETKLEDLLQRLPPPQSQPASPGKKQP